jgi:hypothetical protein
MQLNTFLFPRYAMRFIWTVVMFFLLSSLAAAQIPYVYNVENTGASYPAPPLPTLANCPTIPLLPDPFAWGDGSGRSTAFSDWSHHRAEFKAYIENYEIGPKPAVDASQLTASYSGNTLTINITANGQSMTMTCAVSIPSGATPPYPVCIGMNSSYGSITSSLFTSRGIVGITFSHNQVTTYNSPSNSDPFYRLYPSLNIDNTGQYVAWAWGVSRIIDALYKVQSTLNVDLSHIAVTGCSYAGKMALFSGALDERVALTIAQESGGGGATSWRYSKTLPDGTVEGLAQTSHQWFKESMFDFGGANVSKLPDDHHMLMAMCAPRALLATGNTDYTWLSNHSCYVCSRAVQQIYSTLGISDRFGFIVDGGHSHCAVPSSQNASIGYFLDKFIKGNTSLSQIVQTYPSSFDTVHYADWYAAWGSAGPSLSVSPTSVSVAAAANSTGTFNITSNTSWTVSSNQTWLTVSPTSGSNNGTVTVTAQQNTGTSTRSATVTVSGTGVSSQAVTVTQAAGGTAPTLSVSPTSLSIAAAANSTGTFSVTSNTSWSVSSNQTWLTASPASGSNNATVTVTAQQNTNTSSRTATVTVSATGVSSQTVAITQAGAGGGTAIIVLGSWSTGTAHTKESGTNRALIFIAHGESTTTMNLSAVTYGGQAMTKVVDYNYNAASGYAYAAAFLLAESGVTAASSSTFNVTWSGTAPGSAGYSSVFLGNVDQATPTGATGTGGRTSNPVTTSSSLATVSGDMVILAATCGNAGSYTLNNGFTEGNDQQISGTVTGVTGHKAATGANETPSATYSSTINRQMIIGLVVKAGTGGGPTLSVSPASVSVAAAANSTGTFSVTSNTSWTVTDNQSWLTVSPASGSNNATVTITAQENTGASRQATVTVSASGVTSQTVTVTQAAAAVSSVNINCGGSANGGFVADQYYSGGSTYTNSATINVSQITSNPPPAAIFNTERYGVMTYTIPNFGAGSAQTVMLYFAETYLSGSGQRSFNVSINGSTVLSNFDIYAAAGGQNRAIAQSFNTTANSSGQIVIQFTAITQNPKINGISVAAGGLSKDASIENGSANQRVIPSDYSLDQCYPNPFNPSTSISFGIPEDAFVSLKVYNALGQEIAELAGREYSAGRHSVTFNASDLASGVYYYAMKAGNFVKVQKMILQK